MFGLGVWEIALIAVVALLVLGPDKLPDAARSLGRALNQFRRAGEDLTREVMNATPEKANQLPTQKNLTQPEDPQSAKTESTSQISEDLSLPTHSAEHPEHKDIKNS